MGHLHVGVRDYGVHLDCYRFLTVEPGFLKKFASEKFTGVLMLYPRFARLDNGCSPCSSGFVGSIDDKTLSGYETITTRQQGILRDLVIRSRLIVILKRLSLTK